MDYTITPGDGSCDDIIDELIMYADASGTLLDADEQQYFGFDATHFTCITNDISVSIGKSVFIGGIGNLYEFTCNFVDSCESTTLIDLQAVAYSGGMGQMYMWDSTISYQNAIS